MKNINSQAKTHCLFILVDSNFFDESWSKRLRVAFFLNTSIMYVVDPELLLIILSTSKLKILSFFHVRLLNSGIRAFCWFILWPICALGSDCSSMWCFFRRMHVTLPILLLIQLNKASLIMRLWISFSRQRDSEHHVLRETLCRLKCSATPNLRPSHHPYDFWKQREYKKQGALVVNDGLTPYLRPSHAPMDSRKGSRTWRNILLITGLNIWTLLFFRSHFHLIPTRKGYATI